MTVSAGTPFTESQATTDIPLDMRELPDWVMWRLESDPDKPGRFKKMPYIADRSALKKAKSNDSTNWRSYDAAREAQAHWKFDGVMFACSPDDSLCGLDFDHCRNKETGELTPWAQQLIAVLRTYTEVSPSGTGVRLFLLGKLPGEGKGIHQANPAKACFTSMHH